MKKLSEKKQFGENYDGPEKKLKIILNSHESGSKESGLRAIPVESWEMVARAGGAKILSSVSTDFLDAYLLSESSLFIWKDKLVMITCGDTSPVMAVPEIMGLIDKGNIARIMYSKKVNNSINDKTSNFAKETGRLEAIFSGKQYHLGFQDVNHMHFYYSDNDHNKKDLTGITLQIYMHDLDNAVMKDFKKSDGLVEFPSGLLPVLRKIIPSMITDSHMFDPSGFSLNGIYKDQYLTIHVTPGEKCSYVSFETNEYKNDYSGIVSDIASFFKPKRFSIVFSSDGQCAEADQHPVLYQGSEVYKEKEENSFDLESGGYVCCRNFAKNAPEEIVRNTANKLFEDSNGSHDWEHTLRVVSLCKIIGETEGAEMDVLTIAAYLHDIGRCQQDTSNGKICHALAGTEKAKGIIRELDITDKKKKNILHCIQSHRFRGEIRPDTKEAKVLFDADKLDAIGAIGVARAYLFAGELGARLHNPDNNITDTKAYSKDDTGYREYMVKLRKIKDRILTDEGRRLAADRHDFMCNFFARFLEEHNGGR